ncbi:M3 family oligoendopeptidase, partial [Desulfomarina sp.]
LKTENVLWNLKDLYNGENDPALEKDIAFCRQEATAINSQYYTTVGDLDEKTLHELVNRLEILDTRLTKLATFSFLNFITRIDNEAAGALDQTIHELYSTCSSKTVFFELEWNSVDDEQVDKMLSSPLLANYRHYLRTMRKFRPHQLSEKEEKLILEKEIVGRNSWTTLFEKIFAHLKFGEQQRTEEEVLTDLYHEDREVRKQAAADMTRGLEDQCHLLSHIFNTLAADKMITDRLRGFDNWLSSMNLSNQLEDSTVKTLIETVVSRYDIVERYYSIKRDLLGLDTLFDYDRYAPLPSLPARQIGWDECKETILTSFSRFSPEMAAIGRDFFEKNWIHAPVGGSKRGGAFAHPCVPDVHPYVLVNYTGNLRDVSTVAHELGHGIHQVLAARQGHYNSDTPLPLAETASVFAELLVFNSQLDLIADQKEQRAFICQKLESIFATVFRQTAMNRFENLMHESRRQEGEISRKKFSSFWLTTQQEMFGDSVSLREDYSLWWSYIPHFLSTPGYVYSYAFGELLVLALYGIYRKTGEPFVEKYLSLLAAGGSASPYDLLQPFGIDLNDAEFWRTGLAVIDEMLARIE